MKQKTYYVASDGRNFFPIEVSPLDYCANNNKEAYEACLQYEQHISNNEQDK